MKHYPASILFFALLLAACTPAFSPREGAPAAVTSPAPAAAAENTVAAAPARAADAAATETIPLPTTTVTSEVTPLAPDQVRIRLAPAYEGFEAPVFLTHAGDGSCLLYTSRCV